MARCTCYHQHGLKFLCYGTKEMEECSCGGDERKCNFYPEKRKQKRATEKRLIDANALKLYAFPDPETGEGAVYVQDIDKAPTVDAVEVVHGEWTVIEDDWNDETIYQCSICKEEFVTIDGTPAENLWNYCPNCGAKMDGDGNDK